MQPNSDDFISVNMLTGQQQNKHVRRESIKQFGGGVNAAGFIWKKMFIIVGNKAKGRISKRMFQDNKAR